MVKPEVLALIPARGGSKSIPRKNIREFAGHPLIAYSIVAGLQSEMVTRVVVSTDDLEIAEIARAYGAEVPFMRPAEMAQDATPDLPVFQHAVRWFAEQGIEFQAVVQLRPTTPVRPLNCVDQAIQILLEHPDADSVRGVVPSGQNPYKMWRIQPDGILSPLMALEGVTEPFNTPRQHLPPTYWQTGHVDVVRPRTLLEQQSMTGRVIYPLVIDPLYTVDLDTSLDWQWAEWLVQSQNLEMVRLLDRHRPVPEQVDLVVFDFDGVFTDNRVWVDVDGREQVAAHRGDGMGIALLRKAGVPLMVLSTEVNPVVRARCAKLKLPVIHGVADKAAVLQEYLHSKQINPAHVIYVGNDINDLPCFPLVGCAVVVADAHQKAAQAADMILSLPGGHGAVREFCDILIAHLGKD